MNSLEQLRSPKMKTSTKQKIKHDQLLVFPIMNTYTPEFSLSTQEALGICDWQAEDDKGRWAVGHSEEEARNNFAKLPGLGG